MSTELERPKGNASTAEWRAYAEALGHTVDAELKRDAIILIVDAKAPEPEGLTATEIEADRNAAPKRPKTKKPKAAKPEKARALTTDDLPASDLEDDWQLNVVQKWGAVSVDIRPVGWVGDSPYLSSIADLKVLHRLIGRAIEATREL